MAVYFHCASHKLNLAVVAACKIQAFKNAEAYVGEIARFFNYSAKRQRLLDRAMDQSNPVAKARKLKDACRTRWIQLIDSYVVFFELLPAVPIVYRRWSTQASFRNCELTGTGMERQSRKRMGFSTNCSLHLSWFALRSYLKLCVVSGASMHTER